jgi:hypothetical protein
LKQQFQRQGKNQIKAVNPFYYANMEALRAHYPDIARLVSKTPVNLDYETISTKSGAATLRIKSRDLYFYDKDEPLKEIEERYHQYKPMSAPLAVFLGFGIGNEVVYFMTKYSKILNTMNIIVIEKDTAMFQLALKTMDLVEIIKHKQVKFIVGGKIDNLFPVFQKYFLENNRYLFIRGAKPIFNKSALLMEREYYISAWRTFRQAAQYAVMNYGNDPKDSIIGIENMLENLKVIIENPGINLLRNKFCNKPAVVVSCGPSLDKNKHLLASLADKAVIIAADSALKPLLHMGFAPHMVAALEREKEVVHLVEDISLCDAQGIYLAACPVVYNEVYQTYPGPNIIVYRNFDHFKWLGIDRGILTIKSSAGNMAFKIAEYLGCNPIILIGQDLSISPEGQTNAYNASLGTEQVSYLREKRYIVKGNIEPEVETTASLKLFLDSYNIDVAGYKGKCINATEGGAYINGTTVMTFQEAIEKYLSGSFNPLEEIKNILGQFTQSSNDYEKVNVLIEKTINSFKKIVNLCEEGFKLFDEKAAELQAMKDDPEEEKLDGIMKQLMDLKQKCITCDPSAWQLFFAHVGQSFYLAHEMEMFKFYDRCDSQEKARVGIALYQREWFEVVGGLMKVCIGVLEKAKR